MFVSLSGEWFTAFSRQWQPLRLHLRNVYFYSIPAQDARCKMQDSGFRIQDARCKMQDPEAVEIEKGPSGKKGSSWNDGIMEWWNDGFKQESHLAAPSSPGSWLLFPNIPVFHIPLFRRWTLDVGRSSSSHFPASCILDPICSCTLKLVDLPN
jgi:hypothetical protein